MKLRFLIANLTRIEAIALMVQFTIRGRRALVVWSDASQMHGVAGWEYRPS
jgi:hypothetical protein